MQNAKVRITSYNFNPQNLVSHMEPFSLCYTISYHGWTQYKRQQNIWNTDKVILYNQYDSFHTHSQGQFWRLVKFLYEKNEYYKRVMILRKPLQTHPKTLAWIESPPNHTWTNSVIFLVYISDLNYYLPKILLCKITKKWARITFERKFPWPIVYIHEKN